MTSFAKINSAPEMNSLLTRGSEETTMKEIKGKYSKQSDVTDDLIRPLVTKPDHDEAEEYVNKVLVKVGLDGDDIEPTPLLRKLSAIYVTYKRAFYNYHLPKDDVEFYQKYRAYESDLRELTQDVIRYYTDHVICEQCEQPRSPKDMVELTGDEWYFYEVFPEICNGCYKEWEDNYEHEYNRVRAGDIACHREREDG